MQSVISTLFKFAIVSVILGAVLNAFDISAASVLKDMGLTVDNVSKLVYVLGAIVIIPVWVVIYLLRPPGMKK
jgi:hypothetical protein